MTNKEFQSVHAEVTIIRLSVSLKKVPSQLFAAPQVQQRWFLDGTIQATFLVILYYIHRHM